MLEALSKESGINVARENFKRLANYAMSADPADGPSEIKQRIRMAIAKLGQDGALRLMQLDLEREKFEHAKAAPEPTAQTPEIHVTINAPGVAAKPAPFSDDEEPAP